jgi:hypothetical protein
LARCEVPEQLLAETPSGAARLAEGEADRVELLGLEGALPLETRAGGEAAVFEGGEEIERRIRTPERGVETAVANGSRSSNVRVGLNCQPGG